MRVAYFTAGNLGAGHLVRGLAIGRGLRRAGFTGEYRIFGPPLPFRAPAVHEAYAPVVIFQDELRDPLRAPESALAQTFAEFAPDVLLVDLFWPPLRFVLPLPGCECWLVTRWLPRQWFDGPPGVPFARAQYARVLAIEPGFTHAHVTHTLPPVVVANPDECVTREAACARFGVEPALPLVVVAHAGRKGEVPDLGPPPTDPRPIVTLDLFDRDAPFPAAEWLAHVDEYHCGAGYNSFWEAQWLGYASRTRFSVLPRQQPEQGFRLAQGRLRARPAENGADVLARMLLAR